MQRLPFRLNLWKIQNIYYKMLETVHPEFRTKAEQGEEAARAWVDRFVALGEKLRVRVP